MWTGATLLWFVIGGVSAAGLLALVLWLRKRNISVRWYEWLIGAIGLFLLFYTIQNFVGSFAEMELTAALMMLVVFGLPSLILLALAWQLPSRRHRQVS